MVWHCRWCGGGLLRIVGEDDKFFCPKCGKINDFSRIGKGGC